jgi:threonine/homoserine/homoserine lactone efflux protein
MSFEIWLAFTVTSILICIVPGPTTIYVLVQSLTHGRKATKPLVFGVIVGDFLCVSLSVLGLGALLAISSSLFDVIKFCGATYLIWLGVNMLRGGSTKLGGAIDKTPIGPINWFKNVMLITALNPKGIIFFTAFMPQFINPDQSPSYQLSLLALTFLVVGATVVLLYSLLADNISAYLQHDRYKQLIDIVGGSCLLGAGIVALYAERV